MQIDMVIVVDLHTQVSMFWTTVRLLWYGGHRIAVYFHMQKRVFTSHVPTFAYVGVYAIDRECVHVY